MNIKEFLSNLNLTDNEADTYLACLKLGTTTVSQLATKTGIKRTTLYDILRNLENKKIINQTIKGKKTLYYAEDPENLAIELKEKQDRLNEFLPFLKNMYQQSGSKATVKYYQGIEGLKDVYRDTLNYNDNMVAFVTENILKHLGQDFADEYKEKRINQNCFVRVIGPDTLEIKEYKKSDQKDMKKTVLVSQKEFPFSIEMNIYGNKVAFMSFKEEIGVIIESSEISQNMKLLFELAWKGAKQK